MRTFKPKMLAVPQAAAIATLPAMSDVELAAAEKIPLKDAARDLSKQFAADLDRALQAAVERHLGAPIADPELLRGRLSHNGIPDARGGTTYYVDGVPVLWAGPVVTRREGDMLHATRDLEQLK